MRLRSKAFPLRVLLLAATLILGQWLLGQHLAQVEAHAAGDGCEWCLTHAPLTGALPSATLSLPSPAVHRPPHSGRFDFIVVLFRPVYASRAPPSLFVV